MRGPDSDYSPNCLSGCNGPPFRILPLAKNLKKVIDSKSISSHSSLVSVIQARKERERAAREELILDHAQRMLLRDGFQNLNLDELAEAVEYSKGTLYLHFKTKEDIALRSSPARKRNGLICLSGRWSSGAGAGSASAPSV